MPSITPTELKGDYLVHLTTIEVCVPVLWVCAQKCMEWPEAFGDS